MTVVRYRNKQTQLPAPAANEIARIPKIPLAHDKKNWYKSHCKLLYFIFLLKSFSIITNTYKKNKTNK